MVNCRALMTEMKNPLEVELFIVGRNQKNRYSAKHISPPGASTISPWLASSPSPGRSDANPRLTGHTPTLFGLFMGQLRRASHPLSAGAGPVQPQPDPLAVRIHLAGPLCQHRLAEELRRGTPLPGVYVFPDGHDADVGRDSSAWMRTPSSKFRESRSKNATTMVSPSRTRAISSCQPGRCGLLALATSE